MFLRNIWTFWAHRAATSIFRRHFCHLLLRWYFLKGGSVGNRKCGVLPFNCMLTRSNIAKKNRDVYPAKQEYNTVQASKFVNSAELKFLSHLWVWGGRNLFTVTIIMSSHMYGNVLTEEDNADLKPVILINIGYDFASKTVFIVFFTWSFRK